MAVDIASARDAYYDNADYEEQDSLAKAKAFLTACVRLQGLSISSSEKGIHKVDLPEVDWEAAMANARAFISAKDATRGRQHSLTSFDNFRD